LNVSHFRPVKPTFRGGRSGVFVCANRAAPWRLVSEARARTPWEPGVVMNGLYRSFAAVMSVRSSREFFTYFDRQLGSVVVVTQNENNTASQGCGI